MMVARNDVVPPTAVFWSEFVGDGAPEDYKMPGMVLHLLYGSFLGTLFVLLYPVLSLQASFLNAVPVGVIYGVLALVVGLVFWLDTVLDMEVDRQKAKRFGMLHLVYGAVIGLWVGLGIKVL